MEESNYRLAGWLAIVQAVMFPVALVIGIIEAVVAGGAFGVRRPFIGPSDLLMIVFTAVAVYTLLMFRKLLHERYQYHDLDLLILISVWWAIVFQVVGLGLNVLAMIFWPVDKIVMAVTFLVFFTGAMVTIGIVDILIAVKLLKIKETVSEYVRGFAYVTMAAGICEVTVLFSPFSLVLVPVTAVILALIFFRDQHVTEFV
jgi:hypothetical protein